MFTEIDSEFRTSIPSKIIEDMGIEPGNGLFWLSHPIGSSNVYTVHVVEGELVDQVKDFPDTVPTSILDANNLVESKMLSDYREIADHIAEMEKQPIPSWDQADEAIQSGKDTPLDRFIHNNEPSGMEHAKEFRADLMVMLDHIQGNEI